MAQLRGYSMSMMLVVLILYHLWSYEGARRNRHLTSALIAVFCLVYTVLSNAYFVLALGAIYVMVWLCAPKARSASGRILLTLALSGLLLALAYAPVWDDFLQVHARQLGTPPPYRTFVLLERLPGVMGAFVSFRYALPILVLAGSFFLLRRSRPSEPEPAPGPVAGGELRRRFYELLVLLFLPFLISFLRNELPYDRTFVHLAPIFALSAAAAIAALPRSWPILQRRPLLAPIALYVYCVATLVYAHQAIQHRLYQDLFSGRREQDILYNYYQSESFTPDADTRRYAAIIAGARRPVIGVDDVDRFATSFHFNRHDVSYFTSVAIEELGAGAAGKTRYLGTYWRTNGKESWPPLTHTKLEFELPAGLESKEFHTLYAILRQKGVIRQKDPDFYVVTPYPERFAATVRQSFPQFRIERLSTRVSYLNLFVIYEGEAR